MTKYLSHSCAKASYYMCIHTSSQRINSTLPGITEAQPLLAPCAILPHEFGSNPILIPQNRVIYVFSIPTVYGNADANTKTDGQTQRWRQVTNWKTPVAVNYPSLRKAARNRQGPNPEQHMWTSVTHSGARRRDLSFLACGMWKILTVGALGKEYTKDKKTFCEFWISVTFNITLQSSYLFFIG